MNILALKLITHEEILGEIRSETPTTYTVCNPVGISVVRGKDGTPNVGFSPFPMHAEPVKDLTIDIDKRNVVYSYIPAEDFINNYNQIFGAGIILPGQQQIITG